MVTTIERIAFHVAAAKPLRVLCAPPGVRRLQASLTGRRWPEKRVAESAHLSGDRTQGLVCRGVDHIPLGVYKLVGSTGAVSAVFVNDVRCQVAVTAFSAEIVVDVHAGRRIRAGVQRAVAAQHQAPIKDVPGQVDRACRSPPRLLSHKLKHRNIGSANTLTRQAQSLQHGLHRGGGGGRHHSRQG